jgi:cephalosporin-C deacetylase-like acetyl esterase
MAYVLVSDLIMAGYYDKICNPDNVYISYNNVVTDDKFPYIYSKLVIILKLDFKYL